MRQFGFISLARLRKMPSDIRGDHEFCYFLHDQCVYLLQEYSSVEAHHVSFTFKDKDEAKQFQKIAYTKGALVALRETGRHEEARRAIINTITLGMVSDCLSHIFEGLKCLEKGKTTVALNLLRKPLKDNLSYLAWMLGDEDQFYEAFTSGPENITQKKLGNLRLEMFEKAVAKTKVAQLIDAELVNNILFNRKHPQSFETWFQHAVHLITVQHEEIKTSPESFNFLFGDDDAAIYEGVYRWLPYLLTFLAHVIVALFDRIRPMNEGSYLAFHLRSAAGFALTKGAGIESARHLVETALPGGMRCFHCESEWKLTERNLARLLMADSYRCPACQHINQFPMSWMLDFRLGTETGEVTENPFMYAASDST